MAEAIRLRFAPEGKDYSRVMRAHSARTRTVWLSLVAMTAILLLFWWTSTYKSQQCLLLYLVIVFGPFFSAFLIFVWQPYRARRRVEKDENLRGETTWEVDDSRIVVTAPLGETRWNWDAFRQVIETRTDFLLSLSASKHMVQFIPKRAFESPAQEAAFRALVRSKLPAGRWV